MNLTDSIYSNEQIKYGLFLTITWQGNSETMHLKKR
jgi:hypothetical protein